MSDSKESKPIKRKSRYKYTDADFVRNDAGEIMEKRCTKCLIVKALQFFRPSDGQGGTTARCRKCESKVSNGPKTLEQKKRIQEKRKQRKQRRKKMVISIKEQACKTCNIVKPADQFFIQLESKTGIDSSCKKCRKKQYEECKQYMISEKKQVGRCENKDCNYSHNDNWKVLDFAHIDRTTKFKHPKTHKIVEFRRLKLADMKIERLKCRIICRNCHRMETKLEEMKLAKTRKPLPEFYQNRKAKYADFVLSEKLRRVACVDCKLPISATNQTVFDFDHRIREEKLSSISKMVSGKKEISTIQEEMKKCDLRCANCHQLKTYDGEEYKHIKRKEAPSASSPRENKRVKLPVPTQKLEERSSRPQ